MTSLRIAVAGAGLIGRRHIELIAANPRCELAAVVDPAPSAVEIAAGAGVPRFQTLGELFAAGRPDAVILATPNRLHVPGATECVAAGVPALIEKPVAEEFSEALALAEAAEAAGVPLLVGHHRRHSPILGRARELVEEGALGRLVAVQGSAIFYKPDDYFDAAPWRREAGGGPVLINLIHEIDNLRFLCGDIVSVQACTSNATRGFPVEDTAAIVLRFANGALGTFLLSDAAASERSWEQTSGENPDYPTHPEENCYVLAGTDGSLAVPTMRLRTYPDRDKRSWWEPFETSTAHVDRADPLAAQLEHFLAVIRGEQPPLATVRDAAETLRVTRAVAEAARTGGVVETGSLTPSRG
ncbi:Gfo/Idh/MocA family protein [Nocardioides insulae]|uniref:Gfo/Idh/MocA family protein n=1 Tax=Nocardioides insulae TaxID=394734 RepID=UPI000490D9DE|nr:Gfo/Idh/MocA family oxidoreductase [Nocardioides insulae]